MPLDEYHFISTRLKNKQTKISTHTQKRKLEKYQGLIKYRAIDGVGKV